MAFKTVFLNSTTQQVLANGDEFILAAGVTLAVDDNAIEGTGSTETAIFGSVVSTGGAAYIISDGTNTGLTIGQDANVYSMGSYAIDVSDANNIDVHNAGTVTANVSSAVILTGVGVNDAVSIDFFNTGTIMAGGGGVTADASEGQMVFNNAGTITAKSAGATLDGDNATIYFNNSGTIAGATGDGVRFLGSSWIKAVNSGTISSAGGDAVSFTTGKFVNAGTLAAGDGAGFIASGEVTLRNTGTILGDVELGDGNDIYRGLNGTVDGGLFGGGGADLILASRGDDDVFGGAGTDSLYGRGDDDNLFGEDDDDMLFGNRGDDTLVGGSGRDTLRGGAGADVFLFESGDSGLRATADVIADFRHRADTIDLSQLGDIDFIATNRFSGAGDAEVRYRAKHNGDVQVQIDEDGDGVADMHIIVENTAQLTAVDFIL